MAQLTGVFRIGKDAELRRTPNGDSVINLSLAYNYGRKGEDGKKPTQWVDGSLWGRQAEALEQYLTKGSQVSAFISDVHIETYQKHGSEGFKLVGRITEIELIGSRQQGDSGNAPRQQNNPNTGAPRQGQAPRQAAPQQRQPAPQNQGYGGGFEDMDDDIPF